MIGSYDTLEDATAAALASQHEVRNFSDPEYTQDFDHDEWQVVDLDTGEVVQGRY